MTIFRAVTIWLCLAGLAFSQSSWRVAVPDYQWSFPKDHWAHSGYRTEWWYFTGHLESRESSDQRFGYQFTLFRVALGPQSPSGPSNWTTGSVVMGHAAITDLSSREHTFSELVFREMPLLGGFSPHPEPRIGWSRGPVGTEENWELLWNGAGFDFQMTDRAQGMAFELSARSERPPVFQGPNGYSRKGNRPSAASQYYSFTRMETTGHLTLGEKTYRVSGESWMDKEFGSNQLAGNQVGWDWFSLQLDDGRELMLYHLRDEAGATDFARGTLVAGDGQAHYLEPREWTVQAMGHWVSPETGTRYPSGWQVELNGEELSLVVTPLVADQENRSELISDLYYWEGAVQVTDEAGTTVGRGYVELTGYGTNNRPPV